MKDFFTAYKSANIRKYVSSTLIALTLSVTVVSALNQAGPRGLLLANVLQAGSPEIVNYTADLMIERHDRTIDLRLGKEAYDVDGLSLTLLGDPEKFLALHSPDPSVMITSSES